MSKTACQHQPWPECRFCPICGETNPYYDASEYLLVRGSTLEQRMADHCQQGHPFDPEVYTAIAPYCADCGTLVYNPTEKERPID